MLTGATLESILTRISSLTIGVLGDLFLDRYLDIDAGLTEPSIETGLDAFQVVRVRSSPGAAGTVINNLVALGVMRVCPVSVIGDDGEGYELRQALARLGVVDAARIFATSQRRTPTYTKPMLHEPGTPPRELNRLDIKNRTPMVKPLQDLVLEGLGDVWPQVNALIVLDQVSEEECGVVTARVREALAQRGHADPDRFILADSRERIGLFRNVCAKPNAHECRKAIPHPDTPDDDEEGLFMSRCLELAQLHTGRPVFGTSGSQGIFLAKGTLPNGAGGCYIPAYPVSGPIDTVGAGDSTSAGIACAVAAGATLEEAAAFGNLVASITIQQIGTTGTATPQQIRQRWQEVSG